MRVGMWAADKPAVQTHLADRLARAVLTLHTPDTTLTYLEAFWDIMAIEWNGIDRLR